MNFDGILRLDLTRWLLSWRCWTGSIAQELGLNRLEHHKVDENLFARYPSRYPAMPHHDFLRLALVAWNYRTAVCAAWGAC